MLRHLVLSNQLAFSRFFFKERDAQKFIVSPHHKIICDTLERVISGEITRLIINVPPGYTKTELAVIMFMARGLAINPRAKFIHTTYSDDLALENSVKAKDIILSEEFRTLFNLQVRNDSKAKKKWYTLENGGVYATASGGPITGFRAGRFEEGFTGAFIVDDPIKPDDAYSDPIRNKINNRFMNTFKSRLAVESRTPMIVIMQRLHEDDPSGFLLRGGTGEKWHHLLLPSPIPPGPVSSWYPKDYTHGIPIEYELPAGALWPFKHNDEQLAVMNRTDPYTTASQYHQIPSPKGGAIFKSDFWRMYDALPRDLGFAKIYCDTAQKTGQQNDYTVFQLWAHSNSRGIFLLDQFRDKVEAPVLEAMLIAFWEKSWARLTNLNIPLIQCRIEDKSSGSSLIQNLRNFTNIPVFAIQRGKDKVTRAHNTVPQVAAGNVWIPRTAEFTFDYIEEFKKFTPLMTHKHDDQIDPTMDAIEDMLLQPQPRDAGPETVAVEDEEEIDHDYYQ